MWASDRYHTDTVRALLSAGAQADLQYEVSIVFVPYHRKIHPSRICYSRCNEYSQKYDHIWGGGGGGGGGGHTLVPSFGGNISDDIVTKALTIKALYVERQLLPLYSFVPHTAVEPRVRTLLNRGVSTRCVLRLLRHVVSAHLFSTVSQSR